MESIEKRLQDIDESILCARLENGRNGQVILDSAKQIDTLWSCVNALRGDLNETNRKLGLLLVFTNNSPETRENFLSFLQAVASNETKEAEGMRQAALALLDGK